MVGVKVGSVEGVDVAVWVGVGLLVGVDVLVAVGVEVAGSDGPLRCSIISCGARAPDSRLRKLRAVLLDMVIARLYVPLPVM